MMKTIVHKSRVRFTLLLICFMFAYPIVPGVAMHTPIKIALPSPVEIALPPPAKEPLGLKEFLSVEANVVLKGQDLKKVLFKRIFAIELYSKEEQHDTNILADISKAIHIKSHCPIPKEKLTDLVNEWLDINLKSNLQAEYAREIEQLHELIIALAEGDSFSFAYLPEEGTHFYFNDEFRGVIKGDGFAKILFSIWLGDNPVDKTIKSNLLAFRRE